MSSSPFKDYVNAYLRVNIPTSEVVSDAYGNPTPKYEQLEIKALLQPTGNPRLISQVGSEKNAQAMSGYLVHPTKIPDSLPLPLVAQAVIYTGIGRQEKGNFEILPTVQDPFLVAQKIDIITRIEGIFRRIN